MAHSAQDEGLPSKLEPLFWEQDFSQLRWPRDREFVIGRVLSAGGWEQIRWLRARAGDGAIRAFIEQTSGRALSPRQLRFWELLLDLPHDRVTRWLRSESRQIWDRRAR